MPGADGVALGEHLEKVERQTGKRPAALDGPECPVELRSIWTAFKELSAHRANNGFGPQRISYVEIDAWSRLTQQYPSPVEVNLLQLLDGVWFREYINSRPKQ